MGRPCAFSQATADRICERLVEGDSLRAICRDEGMPAASTVFKWLNEFPEFSERYTRAREMQADLQFDEIVEIADDGRNDWMEKESGGLLLNKEAIQRSALRVDTRKWRMSKMVPKKYADRLDVNHSGAVKVDTAPDLSGLDDGELRVLRHLLEKGASGDEPTVSPADTAT